jgi:hypothetical protein
LRSATPQPGMRSQSISDRLRESVHRIPVVDAADAREIRTQANR